MGINPGTITSLSTILTTLAGTPGALNILGSHLSQANEMVALSVLDDMAANPAAAGALMPRLTAIPNMPATVMNWVDQALANPAAFANNMAQAKNALLTAAVSSGTLGDLFSNL